GSPPAAFFAAATRPLIAGWRPLREVSGADGGGRPHFARMLDGGRENASVASVQAVEYCIPGMSQGARNPRPVSVPGPSAPHPAAAVSPRVEPIASPDSFKTRAYAALKDAIVAMDVYRSRADIRLDERRLASDFGISRTPPREATAPPQRDAFLP